MKNPKIKILTIFTGIVFLLISGSCGQAQHRQGDKSVMVTRVIDGDTFVALDASGAEIRVRLIGIDAPESRRSRNQDIEVFGKESKENLTRLIGNSRVILRHDVNPRDRFNRVLAYVYLEDGTFVNATMIEGGYAQVATFPPNVRHSEEFLRLERKARGANRGLWRYN
ncbi:MAG TPA: thermonuclease family protein [Bacteroidales bacterium]|nr:thermonuclease family protein [Bacteroidales bacterium]